MSGENKRYFWLKIQQDFFNSDTAIFLESQENGDTYIIFYLKLCCLSLKDNGVLARCVGLSIIPYDDFTLSKLTRVNIDTVRVAMALFLKIGLLEEKQTGIFQITQIQEMTGSETQKAEYMRKRRLLKSNLIEGNNVTQEGNNVTQEGNNVTQECNNVLKCYAISEKEKEKEKEKEFDIIDRGCAKTATPPPIPSKDFSIPSCKRVYDFYITYQLCLLPYTFWNYQTERNWKITGTGETINSWRALYRSLDSDFRNQKEAIGEKCEHNPFLEFDTAMYKEPVF